MVELFEESLYFVVFVFVFVLVSVSEPVFEFEFEVWFGLSERIQKYHHQGGYFFVMYF